MIITLHGDNFFRVQSGSTTIIVDPNNDRMKPDLTLKTITHPDKTSPDLDVVDTAGEYDIKDISILGLELTSESSPSFIKTIYRLSGLEDIRIVFLGHISSIPEGDTIDKLGSVDILCLPSGSDPYISVFDAQKLIKQIEPKIVLVSPTGQSSPDKVATEFKDGATVAPKLTIKKKDLPDKGTSIIVLTNE